MNDPAQANIFHQIQSLCRKFRRRLKQGENPRIEDYLGLIADAGRQNLFQNLLQSDIEFHHKQGYEAIRSDRC